MTEASHEAGWNTFAASLAQLPPLEREQQWAALTKDQQSVLLFHTRKQPIGPLAPQMTVAGLSARILAWALDLALCWALALVAFGSADRLPALTYAGFILAALYFLFSDALPNGQSIGKRICGIRVVDWTTGRPCNARQALLRNIAHLAGIFDWAAALRANRRRGGDELGSTAVVKARPAASVAAA